MPGYGYAYGKGHGKGKPDKPDKNPPYQPPPPPQYEPYQPPYEPMPPPINDDMSQNCFGSSCPPPKNQPKTTRKRNTLTFRTKGVRGVRRYGDYYT